MRKHTERINAKMNDGAGVSFLTPGNQVISTNLNFWTENKILENWAEGGVWRQYTNKEEKHRTRGFPPLFSVTYYPMASQRLNLPTLTA